MCLLSFSAFRPQRPRRLAGDLTALRPSERFLACFAALARNPALICGDRIKATARHSAHNQHRARSPSHQAADSSVVLPFGAVVSLSSGPMAYISGKQAFLQILRQEGVSVMFGNPGTTELPLMRSEEHTSELQSRLHLVCRLLLEKKKKKGASTRSSRYAP